MAAHKSLQAELALNIALAVIASSHEPMLLLDGELGVVAASRSFCLAFQIDPAGVSGRPLAEIGAGEWRAPQLRSLLLATGAGHAEIEAYEMDLIRSGKETRRLVLHAQKLSYVDEDNVRLLVSVTDITDARTAERLKDDMLREKAMLLQELQHRVANSLQIIASVLLQSARRVQSVETRGHLREAHQRVMSVAAMQKQLSISRIDKVELRPYFSELCQSIGASMIRDPAKLKLEIDVDGSVTSSDVSVSLGLIVTELVINSLKHAFPPDRAGKIVVSYHADGNDWQLSVVDDGVGMPAEKPRPGLGTSIVNALAKQLHALVDLKDLHPGTSVSIIHRQDTPASDHINALLTVPAI